MSDPGIGEEESWRRVLASWEDESAHRAYLSSFSDLDGLIQAGRRYRAILEERPSDPVALRWRDEVVKRATVQGLAQLPRTRAPAPTPRWVRAVVIAVVIGLLGFVAVQLFRALGAGWRGQ